MPIQAAILPINHFGLKFPLSATPLIVGNTVTFDDYMTSVGTTDVQLNNTTLNYVEFLIEEVLFLDGNDECRVDLDFWYIVPQLLPQGALTSGINIVLSPQANANQDTTIGINVTINNESSYYNGAGVTNVRSGDLSVVGVAFDGTTGCFWVSVNGVWLDGKKPADGLSSSVLSTLVRYGDNYIFPAGYFDTQPTGSVFPTRMSPWMAGGEAGNIITLKIDDFVNEPPAGFVPLLILGEDGEPLITTTSIITNSSVSTEITSSSVLEKLQIFSTSTVSVNAEITSSMVMEELQIFSTSTASVNAEIASSIVVEDYLVYATTDTTIESVLESSCNVFSKEIYHNEYQSLPWPVNDWTGPDAEANIVQFPVCEHIDILSGRVIGSIGTEVIWSEYGLPGLWDSAQNVARFPSRITMLKATEGGIYVSDSRSVHFLSGNNPNEWIKKTVLSYPACEWADYKKYIDPSKFGFESTAESILFMTTQGLVVGFPDGTVFNLTDQKYTPSNKGYSSIEIVDDTDIVVSSDGGSLQIQGEIGKAGRKAVCESTQRFSSVLVLSDGELIGASPNGLFVVSGVYDGTSRIDKAFTLGTTDFGEGHQKSIKYLYVSMYGAGDFVLSIMVDRSGDWFDYPFTTYNEGINRERVDIGLGLCGRHFTIKITTAEDFELERIDAAIVVSKFSRRTR